jgi:hypothetical protein
MDESDGRPCQIGGKGGNARLDRSDHRFLQSHSLHELLLGVDQGDAKPKPPPTQPKRGHQSRVAGAQHDYVIVFTL